MAKQLKKQSIQKPAPEIQPSDDPGIAPIATLAILIAAALYLSIDLFRRKKRIVPALPRKIFFRKGSATEKQKKYLEGLVFDQNFYRAKPLTVDDHLRRRSKAGTLSIKVVAKMIGDLKQENEDLRNEFEKQKRRENVGRYRGNLHVTDLTAFGFCERSSYFSSHQFPNQNLVNLKYGTRAHETYANSEGRNSKKQSKVMSFIQRHDPSIVRIEWFANTQAVTWRHQSRSLSGRPDGLVHFADGTKAVIEFKTISDMKKAPRTYDFQQAEIYALLSPTPTRDEVFLLYEDQVTRTLSFYRRKRKTTEYDLAQIMARVERGSKSIDELGTSKSAARCKSCGYRSICGTRAAA